MKESRLQTAVDNMWLERQLEETENRLGYIRVLQEEVTDGYLPISGSACFGVELQRMRTSEELYKLQKASASKRRRRKTLSNLVHQEDNVSMSPEMIYVRMELHGTSI